MVRVRAPKKRLFPKLTLHLVTKRPPLYKECLCAINSPTACPSHSRLPRLQKTGATLYNPRSCFITQGVGAKDTSFQISARSFCSAVIRKAVWNIFRTKYSIPPKQQLGF